MVCNYCGVAISSGDSPSVGCDNCWEVRKRLVEFMKSPVNRTHVRGMLQEYEGRAVLKLGLLEPDDD